MFRSILITAEGFNAKPGRIRALVTALSIVALAAATLIPSVASVAAADTSTTPTASSSQTVVDLGAAGSYSAISPNAVTSDGGTSAGAIGPSDDVTPLQAQQDLAKAYNALAALTPTALIDGDLGGRVITPGIYRAGAALAITTSVTFDALGDPNAVFIFQVGAAVNTTATSRMLLANGAKASHIYWQVVGAVTTGASSFFVGTILGDAAITAGAGTSISGRALSIGGAVTLDSTILLGVADMSMTSAVAPVVDVEAGDTVVFTNSIRNRGNVALALSLSAGLPDSAVTTLNWPDRTGRLAAGQTMTATTTYVPSLMDAAARFVLANALVTGTPVDTGTDAVSAISSVMITVFPTPVSDTISTSRSKPVTFNVLANDAGAETGATFSRATQGTAPGFSVRRLIGAASGPVPSAPVNGSVSCVDTGVQRGQCTYQPAGDFTGTDSFDYSLAQDTRTWNVRVTVTVTAGIAAAPTARPVRVVATSGGPSVTFDPRANSTDSGTATLTLINVTPVASGQGALVCTTTLCTFTPPSGFTGIATAFYTEADVSPDGTTGLLSTPASISLFIDPPAIAAAGFVSAAALPVTAAVGSWSGSTTVTAAAAVCTAGRPSTALSWLPVAGVTSWVLQRRAIGPVPADWITLGTLPPSTVSFVDRQVGEANTYIWRVRPDNNRWRGQFSIQSSQVTELPSNSSFGC